MELRWPPSARAAQALAPKAGSLLAVALAVALTGCKGGATVTVDISVPRPLIEPIDVTMGVYFDDTLQSYVHQEKLEDYGTYSIDIGASQAPVFKQVFEAMFAETVTMVATAATTPTEGATDDAEDAPADGGRTFASADGRSVDVQGVLAPTIEEVQFAIPDQTGGEFYEVWIRYRIQLFDAAGASLAEWPLIGYGKANQRNYGTIEQKEAGLNMATTWALRDAAALLSSQFRGQAQVQNWLAATTGTTP